METEKRKLKIAIPKGSLQEVTLKIFKDAGFSIDVPERSYYLKIDDPEIKCFLLRPQEIPRYIEEGKLDLGISGDDWIAETEAEVVEICDLKYSKQKMQKVKWVLAVPENSPIKTIKDLQGKTISTEVVNLAGKYLEKNKIKARVNFSWGTTEVKAPLFADAVIDLTETGSSLAAHKLKVLDVIFESSTKLIANKDALKDEWKKEKINNLGILLKGAVDGIGVVGVALHAPKEKIEEILKIIPFIRKPTVNKVAGTNFYDIMTEIPKRTDRSLFLKLKNMGCEGIIEFPLNKVVL